MNTIRAFAVVATLMLSGMTLARAEACVIAINDPNVDFGMYSATGSARRAAPIAVPSRRPIDCSPCNAGKASSRLSGLTAFHRRTAVSGSATWPITRSP